MRQEAWERLKPLLEVLRAMAVLEEVRPAAFHLDGEDFVHFHDEAEGLFADARLSKGRVRMPVSTPEEQSELLDRIDQTLSSLEGRSRGRSRVSGRGHRR